MSWTVFKDLLEGACQNYLSSGLHEAIKEAAQTATRTLVCSPKYSQFDLELERPRAIRRPAERIYRCMKSIHDLRKARRTQKKIQRRIDKLESE